MSTSLNSIASSLAVADTSSSSKTKKRKHEGKDGRHSNKKRKHDEALVPDAVSPAPEEAPQAASKKKEKKKSKKKDVVAEETASNGRGRTATKETQPADKPTTAAELTPEPLSTTKSKKKKSKSKPAEGTATDDPFAATANGTGPADDDVELPDAPAPHPDAEALPSTSNTVIADLLSSSRPSSFHSTRLSLLLSIPAIAISGEHALSSILAIHLSPLLLTYFPPARGIVLAFSDTVLSAEPGPGLNAPLRPPHQSAVKLPTGNDANGNTLEPVILSSTGKPTGRETLSLASDEFGACWVWLTATLLVLRPERGDELTGWANVVSEGFVGVVGYNYFQAAVGKARIPSGWKWLGATGLSQQQRRKGRKGRLGGGLHSSQDADHAAGDDDTTTGGPVYGLRSADEAGYFVDENGDKVPEVLKFRVVDTEMVPAHEAGALSLQIYATLLEEEAEKALIQEEKQKFEKQQQQQGHLRTENGEAVMSGGLA